MKKLLFGVIAFNLLLSSCLPAYVVTQPSHQEGFRPPQPSPFHVWVDGNWFYQRRSKTYMRTNGYWSRPSRGRTYHAGHWQSNKRGYRWSQGRWK